MRNALIAGMILGSVALSLGQTDPGAVNMTDRESARSWFNTWWPKTTGAAMGFTGNIDAGIPGDISPAYRDQILLRYNIYRRMVGEQPVTMSAASNRGAQAAAVLCAANDDLRHNPPTSWKFYTTEAAVACSKCEITSSSGPNGINDFMIDFGANNKAVGHRGNILIPNLQIVGFGSTPGHPTSVLRLGVLALWDEDIGFSSRELNITEPFVQWPARGFIPFYLIPGRWSVEIPDSFTTGTLTFIDTTVIVTRSGQELPVKYGARNGGSGVVFTLDGTSEGSTGFTNTIVNGEALNGLPVQSGDVTFHVTISNIKVRATGALWNGTGKYEYDVIGYNPSVATVVPGTAANLVNLSTRSFAGAESSTQIAGFIISGSAPRKVLIRAGGPHLTQFGVDGALADPLLTVFTASGVQLAQNDDWGADAVNVNSVESKVGTIAFPAGSKDAALVLTLPPGGYTAHVTGKGSGTGNALVEVFDADDGTASKLTNISTRSFVGTGSNVQIGGFILHGTGPRKVLIRAGGPYLSQYGVANVLSDPVLTVFKSGTQISQNDDWGSASAEVTSAVQALGVTGFVSGSKDAAVVLTLDPENGYTAQVSGKNGGTGNALIEVFQLPDSAP